jgi:glycosyltransferase involved in cell wall biosynthesis
VERAAAVAPSDEEYTQRLAELRASEEYERPYAVAAPVVSITIPTVDRAEVLRTRSVRSALEQTYPNVEVVVVGDGAPPEVEDAVRSFGDDRVRYVHRPERLEFEDRRRRWLVGSVMARNEAFRAARGDWIVAFDDDDEMHPRHVEVLLDAARSQRLEVAYGRFRTMRADGHIYAHGEFPPRFTRFTFQSALLHGGLRFFERQLAAADSDVPNDWFTCEAMLRAGVRFGMVRQIVCDLYPSPGSQAVREGAEQHDPGGG